MKHLDDKQRLAIIDGIKAEIDKTVEERKKNPNWKPATKSRIQFADEFDAESKAWLIEVFTHYGVNITFDLGVS